MKELGRGGVNATLLLVAMIWGFGFVPQRLGLDYLGPYAFNALRFACGAAVLLIVLVLLAFTAKRRRVVLRPLPTVGSGVVLGLLLFGGATAQQVSLQYTSIANVAFITGMYVIVVPILGLFLGRRYSLVVWGGGLLALVGLYLITVPGGASSLSFSLSPSFWGDALALVGAVFWAVHLLAIASLVQPSNQLQLAFLQFLFCSIFSVLVALIYEPYLLPQEFMGYFWAGLNGVVVVGFAYTLQLVAMQRADPFVAAIVFSLEAVFGALAAYWFLGESIQLLGYFGATLMLIGCVLAQLDERQPTGA